MVISDKVMALSQVPLLLPSVAESKPKDKPRFRGKRLHKDLNTRTQSSLRVCKITIYTGNTDRSTLTFVGSEALALIGVDIPLIIYVIDYIYVIYQTSKLLKYIVFFYLDKCNLLKT